MKKFLIFVVIAIFTLVFAGCPDPDDGKKTSLPNLTIRNDSAYDITNVSFSGISFGDIPKSSGYVTKQLTESAVGNPSRITFTRADIGIVCQTAEARTYTEDDIWAINDSFVVEEVGNTNNRGTLGQITFQSQLNIEYAGINVAKDGIVNFFETIIGNSKPNDFIIKNNGVGKLLLTAGGNELIKIDGAPAGIFTVVQPTSNEIAPNGSLPFRINFNPQNEQQYTATVTISWNSQNNEDFTFTITATGALPKPIAVVLYEDNEIPQNGPIDAGAELITSSKTLTVIIRNDGAASLNIDTTDIHIIGTDSTAFSIINPGNIIPVGTQSTFFIQFKPVKAGVNTATLTIPTNDSSRNPIIIILQGIGVQGNPVLKLSQGSTDINNNSLSPFDFGRIDVGMNHSYSFTIKNIGNIPLELSGNPIVSSSNTVFSIISQPSNTSIIPGSEVQFVIQYQPTVEVVQTSTITIANNSNEPLFTFTVTGTGYVKKPSAVILFNNNQIPNNGTIANATEALITQMTMFSLTIKNNGDAVLGIDVSNMTITGTDAAAFTRLTSPATVIQVEEESSFNIEFRPTKEGEHNATLTIPTNDNSKNPYIVHIKAFGEIGTAVLHLSQGSTSIANKTTTPFDFGTVDVGEFRNLTFTIKNNGNIDLELTGTPIVESTNSVFSVPTQPSSIKIAPEATVSFVLRYTPTAETESNGTITIMSNHAYGGSDFSFPIKGTGYEKKPQIVVRQNTTVINNVNGVVDFGTVATDEYEDIILTIGNSGDANLSFILENENRVNLENNTNNHFTIYQPASATVTPEGTTNFTVRFNPTAEGNNLTATVKIKTNSRNNDEFTFIVSGNGYQKKPQIFVRQNTTPINPHGEYDFGNITVGDPREPVFVIENTGDAPLNFVIVDDNRINLADNTGNYFLVIQPGASTVMPGEATTFAIRFSPTATGTNFTATVLIKTDSQNNEDFSFTARGNGVLAAPSGVIASALSSNRINVSWNAVSGATSYRVHYATSISGTKFLIDTVTGTSAIHTGLQPLTRYFYFIEAISSSDTSEFSASADTMTLTSPAGPTGVVATALSTTSVQTTWQPVSGAVSYILYYMSTLDNNETHLVDTITTGTSYLHTGLRGGLAYVYEVKAILAHDELTAASATAGTHTALPPVNLTYTRDTISSCTLTWEAPLGGDVLHYRVLAGSSPTNLQLAGTTTNLSTIFNNLTSGTNCYFAIQAVYQVSILHPQSVSPDAALLAFTW